MRNLHLGAFTALAAAGMLKPVSEKTVDDSRQPKAPPPQPSQQGPETRQQRRARERRTAKALKKVIANG